MSKTSTPRAAKHRAGRMAKGLVRIEVWGRPGDRTEIRQFAAELLNSKQQVVEAKLARMLAVHAMGSVESKKVKP